MNAWSGAIVGAAIFCTQSASGQLLIGSGDADLHRSDQRGNTFTYSTQDEAALALNPVNESIAVWSSRRQQDGCYGVYAQRYDASGVPRGGETCVNLWTDSHQSSPAAAAAIHHRLLTLPRAGSCVMVEPKWWVVWHSHGQDGDAGAIIGRCFDRQFRGGSEFLVNEQWQGHQSDPVVTASRDGRVLVLWTSINSRTGRSQVRGRLYFADGRPLSGEFGLDASPDSQQRTPGAAFMKDGSFWISFAQSDERGAPESIRLRHYDRDGAAISHSEVVVRAEGDPIEPVIGATSSGLFVFWLESPEDAGRYRLLGQRLDGRAELVGKPFAVGQLLAGSQSAPAMAVAPSGEFWVAFNSHMNDDTEVYVQHFDADGRERGMALPLASGAGEQRLRPATSAQRLACSPAGDVICAWSGDGGWGDDSSVNVTMLSPNITSLVFSGVQAPRVGSDPAEQGDAAPALPAAPDAKPHVPPSFDPERVSEQEPREVIRAFGETGFTGIFNTGWTPPDPHMGVGPDHIVLMTNGGIAFFTKDGTETFFDEIESSFGFWGALGATSFVFDPEALYDPLSGRFFAMASEAFAPGGRSYVLLAVSDDSDPNGVWFKYRFETTSLSADVFDSPNIGVDENVVYITGDKGGFESIYPVLTFDKASLLAGDPPAVTRSVLMPTSTESAGFPAVSFDSPPALYLIEHKEAFTNGSVRLIALTDPLGSPTFTDFTLTVPTYGEPEDPPQQGTAVRPETFDARFWSVAYRNGSLWATHHINSARVLARWYEIAMNGWPVSGGTPELVQSGEIDPGSTVRTYFSAITVDDFGNAAMTYARSSPTEFISMGTAYRYASDPPGAFPHLAIRQTSTGPYTFLSRWGDYGAVRVDPADGKTMWAHHEFAVSNDWRTWVHGWTPFFGIADLDCDGSVGFSDLLLLISDWGPCAGCPTDLDDDGVVGFTDLVQLLSDWG